MDQFEKVERLVQKTGVSFEEAKAALEQAGGDMLDAMIVLEKNGKAKAPDQSVITTQYETQQQYDSVAGKVESVRKSYDSKEKTKEFGEKVKAVFLKIIHFLSNNYIVMARRGETKFRLPLWAVLIILLSLWHVTLIAFIISLFMDCSYRFEGESNMKTADNLMEQASQTAEKIKEEYNKL